MADKNFGVKGINFISDPGTPTISIASSTISYAGSLNLNADTVAISTNISIGGSVVSNIIVSDAYSVGIGTTNPTSKLWVQGDVRVSGTLTATSFVGSGASLTGLVSNQLVSIDDAQPHYILLTKSQSGTSSTVSSSYNYIYYNPNSKRLGIGTDSPTANLDVNGTGRFISTITAPTFQGTATTATTALGFSTTASVNTSGIITATGGFNIGIQSGGTNITTGVITAINFVGSGNTFSYNSATKVVDVTISASSGSGFSSVSISTNTTNQAQYIPYIISFGNTTGFGATTLLVYNPSSGNLGIGTTNPTSKLHVAGDVRFTGITTVGFLTATNAYVGVATVGFITATNAYVGVATVGFLTATNAYVGVATVGFITATNAYVGVATVGFITATSAYIGVVTVGFLTATNAYIGVATVGFLTATNAYIGVATVGFLTATNVFVSGVTTSGGVVVTTSNDYKIGVTTVLNSTTLGSGVTNSSLTSVGTLRQLNVSFTGITTVGFITAASAYVSGVITATTFSSGISSETVGFTTSTISGPSLIYISPYKVGLSSGTVRIVGNLIVEGSTTTETQATIQTSSKTIGIAVSFVDETLLDGAGIGIGSTSIQKTLLWQNDSKSLKSNVNLNVGAGKSYQINDNTVLSSTTLGTGVTISSLTSVGSLKQLVVSSDTSTDAVRITQVGSGNALIVEDEANPDSNLFVVNTDGSVGIGTTNPTSKLHVAGDVRITGVSTLGVTTTTNLTSQQLNVSGITTVGFLTATNAYIGVATVGFITATNAYVGVATVGFLTATDAYIGVATVGFLTASSLQVSGITTTQTLNVGTGGTVITTTSSGSVGIGTTNPTSKLFITNNNNTIGLSTGAIPISPGIILQNSAGDASLWLGNDNRVSAGLGTLTNNGSVIDLSGKFSSTEISGSVTFGRIGAFKENNTSDDFSGYLSLYSRPSTYAGNLVEAIRIDSSQRVGIGTAVPTSKLHVQGDAYITGVTTSTDFDSLSDFNLKTNIQQIDDSLAKVIQIRGVTFNWKDTNRSSAGVIAQEVEKVLPELVNGEETKTVNYNGVVGALVEAVKELKAENDVLKERLDEVYKKVFG